jgi:hypothetical protein
MMLNSTPRDDDVHPINLISMNSEADTACKRPGLPLLHTYFQQALSTNVTYIVETRANVTALMIHRKFE